jgi:pimeloyl-ACP methyl ester carboxylesterase
MEIWDWFSENEKLLSGLAAALVIIGAFATVGRGFFIQIIIRLGVKPSPKATLSDLSAPSPHAIQFANTEGVNIAYTVFGKSSPDLVVTPGIISNIHVSANLKPLRETMKALSQFCRVISFDKRGQGLSDPVASAASLTERVKDIEAVADAADTKKFVLMGISEGGPMSIKYAVDNPDRVAGLILFGTTPRFSRADDYAIGISDQSLDGLAELWGTAAARDILFPSISRDEIDDETYKGMEMLLADKRSMKQIVEYMKAFDVRDLLAQVTCPTLIVHFSGDLAVPARMGRYLANGIPNSDYLEIAGVDHCDLAQAPNAIKRIKSFMKQCA